MAANPYEQVWREGEEEEPEYPYNPYFLPGGVSLRATPTFFTICPPARPQPAEDDLDRVDRTERDLLNFLGLT